MPIRKIRANSATEDGDYIRTEDKSTRWLTGLAGAVFGIFVGILTIDYLSVENEDAVALVIIIAGLFLAIGFLLGRNRVVRRVPKTDVVEIKKSSFRKVTVVLDDERVKRPYNNDPKAD